MTIGRNPDNDVCIDDTVVSSYHARIITRNGRSYVYDLNSTNGTFVNSRLASKQRLLKHGDVITITKYQIKYTIDDNLSEAGEARDTGHSVDTTDQRKMWRDTVGTRTMSVGDLDDLDDLADYNELN